MSTAKFVLVGPLKGRTMRHGPNKKYRFVNGEVEVPLQDKELVKRSLRYYCAFPIEEAEAAEKRLFAKAEPKKAELKKAEPEEKEPEEPEEEEPEEEEPKKAEPEEELTYEALVRAIRELNSKNADNPDYWTKSGNPRVGHVRDGLPEHMREYVDKDAIEASME